MKKSVLIAVALLAPLAASCGSSSGSGSAASYCTLEKTFRADQDKIGTAFGGTSSPADVKKVFADYVAQIKALNAAAPAEIKKDIASVSKAFNDLDSQFASVGYDVKKAEADPATLKSISDIVGNADMLAASKRVSEYGVKVCGDVPSATGS